MPPILNEFGEFHHFRAEGGALFGAGTAEIPILLPFFSEIGEATHPGGLEQQTIGIAEMFLQKMVIDLLDEGVKAEVFAIVLPSHGEINQRMAGARGRAVSAGISTGRGREFRRFLP